LAISPSNIYKIGPGARNLKIPFFVLPFGNFLMWAELAKKKFLG
jgi:hypothetical protein